MNKIKEKLNFSYYAWKRNNWIFDFRRYIDDYSEVKIDRPIFLLGVQGGGLTLISRMIRRNEKVVSVSGNYKYWAGADEMQNVLGPILPKQFTGIKHKVPYHPEIGKPRGWLYGSNELVDEYRNDVNDVTPELKNKFRKIIRWMLYRHSLTSHSRFTDKSQIYTLKVSFLNEILKDTNPKFILITRNPYAVCYRAPFKSYSLKQLNDNFSFEDKLHLASQNWANSIKYALDDKEKTKEFLIIRFEDILKEPEKNMKKICDFAELDYNKNMIPQPYHDIPFGSVRLKRWHPLRTDVNEKYLNKIKEKDIEIINQYCKKYADKFNYTI